MKKLIYGLKNNSGRNNTGKITSYHRGSGLKNRYRIVDFFRFIFEKPGKVLKRLMDPNRSSFIFLVCYSNGILSFVLGVHSVNIGDFIYSSKGKGSSLGGCFFLYNILKGSIVHNLEAKPFNGFKYIRSAGSSGVVLNKFNKKYFIVKLPSGEFRAFLFSNRATIGIVSNLNHRYYNKGKAGVSRFLNIRPHVRGVAKNPVDHPHGGQTSGGIHPVSPWARLTKGGKKTLNNLSKKNNLIIKRRNFKKRNV